MASGWQDGWVSLGLVKAGGGHEDRGAWTGIRGGWLRIGVCGIGQQMTGPRGLEGSGSEAQPGGFRDRLLGSKAAGASPVSDSQGLRAGPGAIAGGV